MKRTLIASAVVISVSLVVVTGVILAQSSLGSIYQDFLLFKQFVAFQEQVEVEEDGRLSGVDNFYERRKVNLIGTGDSDSLNFQFADTPVTGSYPQLLDGSTPTPSLLVGNANMVSIYTNWLPSSTGAFLNIDLAVSNDAGCNNHTSADRTGTWFPLIPSVVTSTSPWSSTATTTMQVVSTGLEAQNFVINLDNVNYNCLELKYYNNSTTDFSNLWVYAIIRE